MKTFEPQGQLQPCYPLCALQDKAPAAPCHASPRLWPLIPMQGGSTDDAVVAQLKAAAGKAKTVLVILDSSHEQDHVLLEIQKLCPLATLGSYCIVQVRCAFLVSRTRPWPLTPPDPFPLLPRLGPSPFPHH